MNAYVLNLDQEPHKWQRMQAALHSRGLNPVRVPAVDSKNNRNAGNLASHLAAVSLGIQDNPNGHLLILEDDCLFPPAPGVFQDAIALARNHGWDGLILGCDLLCGRPGPDPALARPDHVTQSHAYLLRPRYTEKYLRWLCSVLPKKLNEPTYGPHTLDLAWRELFQRDQWLAFWPPMVLQDSEYALPWHRNLNDEQVRIAYRYGWKIG